MAEQP